MTRMIARAYRFADAFRAAGIPVVMGGPHVTELPGEALGRDGGPKHADAVALGEADETWPKILQDAASGRLLMSVHAYVIRTGRHVVLVDTCIGNDKERPSTKPWHKLDTPWLADLGRLGVAPEQVQLRVPQADPLHRKPEVRRVEQHRVQQLDVEPDRRFEVVRVD